MTQHHHGATGLIGASIPRVEDEALITGAGQYVDDVQLPGMLHMAVVRSPHPKARILSIDTAAARAMPGVEAVITSADLAGKLNVVAVAERHRLLLGDAHLGGVGRALDPRPQPQAGDDRAEGDDRRHPREGVGVARKDLRHRRPGPNAAAFNNERQVPL